MNVGFWLPLTLVSLLVRIHSYILLSSPARAKSKSISLKLCPVDMSVSQSETIENYPRPGSRLSGFVINSEFSMML